MILGWRRTWRSPESNGWRHSWSPARPTRDPDEYRQDSIGIEWAAGRPWPKYRGEGSMFSGVSVKVSTTGEETLDVGLGVPGVRVWVKYDRYHRDGTRFARARGWAKYDRFGPNGRQVRLPGVRFEGEVTPTGVSWCIGPNDHSWATNASWRERLRRNDLHWLRFNRTEIKAAAVVWERDVQVVLPERTYAAKAILSRRRWRLYLGPYRLTRTSKRRLRIPLWPMRPVWRVEVDVPDGAPVPGKGENSWDCGPDATSSITFAEVRSIDPAGDWAERYAKTFAEDVLRVRKRRGVAPDYSERDEPGPPADPGKAAQS